MCNEEVHELLIQEGQVNCIFCNKQIQDSGKPKQYFCCKNMKLIKDKLLVCKNCGQVHNYLTADEYVDFYENRHKMKRKSVYHRKYHILNVINNIAQNNNIQVGYYNREKILRIFRLIDQVNNFGRKRLISVNFIIKQLFDILGVEYKIIPLTQSKNTVRYYENWWERVYSLIKADFLRISTGSRESPYYSLIERPWGRGYTSG